MRQLAISTQKMLLTIDSETLSLQEIPTRANLSEEEVLQYVKSLERCHLVKNRTF